MIEIAAKTTEGIKRSNDDRILVNGTVIGEGDYYEKNGFPTVVAVCDGIGGYNGGFYAAEIVARTLGEADVNSVRSDEYLFELFNRFEENIEKKRFLYPEFSNMSTTLVACALYEDSSIIFHSGDSRLYRFDGQYLNRLTRDHSVIQSKVDLGLLRVDELKNANDKNVIERCIGMRGLYPEIKHESLPILSGETYMLCSDGLWGVMESEEIERVLSDNIDLVEKADKLIKKALELNSEDNISVCLCYRRFEDE